MARIPLSVAPAAKARLLELLRAAAPAGVIVLHDFSEVDQDRFGTQIFGIDERSRREVVGVRRDNANAVDEAITVRLGVQHLATGAAAPTEAQAWEHAELVEAVLAASHRTLDGLIPGGMGHVSIAAHEASKREDNSWLHRIELTVLWPRVSHRA
jgi:hypothetical protein